jgi:hypothetical protein
MRTQENSKYRTPIQAPKRLLFQRPSFINHNISLSRPRSGRWGGGGGQGGGGVMSKGDLGRCDESRVIPHTSRFVTHARHIPHRRALTYMPCCISHPPAARESPVSGEAHVNITIHRYMGACSPSPNGCGDPVTANGCGEPAARRPTAVGILRPGVPTAVGILRPDVPILF